MKLVLDTNVLLSGIFFGGIPGEILDAWKAGRVTTAVSPPIISEYRRVGEELEKQYGELGFASILALVVENSEVVEPVNPAEPISDDRDDDKFLACAEAAGARIVVSGDDDLLSVGTWNDIRVMSPRVFRDAYLSD